MLGNPPIATLSANGALTNSLNHKHAKDCGMVSYS